MPLLLIIIRRHPFVIIIIKSPPWRGLPLLASLPFAALWAAFVNYLIYVPFRKAFPTCTRAHRFIHGVAHRPTMVRTCPTSGRGAFRRLRGARGRVALRCSCSHQVQCFNVVAC